MNYFWASRRDMTSKNRRIRSGEHYNQILNTHQSPRGQFIAPQTMPHRPQSYPSLNNFTQGRYRENIITVDANNSTSLIAAARYGRRLPLLGLPSGPRNISLINVPSHAKSAQNSSSNGGGFGLQGYGNGFPNPSRTILHNNQMNLPYLNPYKENSNRMNNNNSSSIFNNFNSFHGVKGVSVAMPTPLRPIQIKDLDLLSSSADAKARERSMKRSVFDIQETNDWKRPRMSFSFTPPHYFEGMQFPKEELLLFKDDDHEKKKTISTSEIANDANENDEENIDLSLHL